MAYREENGAFKNRKQLLKVAKLGPKAFEQCAGFMRIADGENPLDGTSVHPESYEAARQLLKKLGYQEDELKRGGLAGISRKIADYRKILPDFSCYRYSASRRSVSVASKAPASFKPLPRLSESFLCRGNSKTSLCSGDLVSVRRA